jgi:glucosamine kinase
MDLYLGVDGGGSGCRAVIADAAGRVLGRAEGGPANIWSDGEGARASLLAVAEAALAAAGGGALSGLRAGLGLAGANVPEAVARLAADLPFRAARIESDAFASLKGALGDADGVLAAIGTGSVYGVQRRGAVRMIGGWGFLLGDQASGAWLGRALFEVALLAHDGVAASSPLLRAVVDERGGPAGVLAAGRAARPADFAAVGQRVVAAAALGDAGAEAILAAGTEHVARAIDALMADGSVPVCFLGGLGPVYAGRLAGRYGDLVRAPEGSALDGALRLARSLP